MAGMGPDDRAHGCCEAIPDELSRRLPYETIFFGPALENQTEPAIVALRARDAHFFWVALPIKGVVFWDAHVGIVIDPASRTPWRRRQLSWRPARTSPSCSSPYVNGLQPAVHSGRSALTLSGLRLRNRR